MFIKKFSKHNNMSQIFMYRIFVKVLVQTN